MARAQGVRDLGRGGMVTRPLKRQSRCGACTAPWRLLSCLCSLCCRFLTLGWPSATGCPTHTTSAWTACSEPSPTCLQSASERRAGSLTPNTTCTGVYSCAARVSGPQGLCNPILHALKGSFPRYEVQSKGKCLGMLDGGDRLPQVHRLSLEPRLCLLLAKSGGCEWLVPSGPGT